MMHAIKLIGKVLLSTPIVCTLCATTTPSLLDCQLSQVCIYYQTFQARPIWMGCSPKAPIMEHAHVIY